MRIFLLHLMTFAAGVTLLLPPGSCGMVSTGTSVGEPAKAGCCHRPADADSSAPQECPDTPKAACCCSWDATLPDKASDSVESTALMSISTVALSDDMSSDLPAVDLSCQAGTDRPRLHLMHCVWRC